MYSCIFFTIAFLKALLENSFAVEVPNLLTKNSLSLFDFNAFCVISDGINNKIGSIFSNYEFFYSWRRIKENETLDFNQDTLISLIKGIISPKRLLDIIDPTPQTVDALMKLDLAAGVDVEIKL